MRIGRQLPLLQPQAYPQASLGTFCSYFLHQQSEALCSEVIAPFQCRDSRYELGILCGTRYR